MTMTLSGDGTITGLVAGGLPNATVTADDLAAGAALNSVSDGVFFRNRIINGDMRIDQRATSVSVNTGGAFYSVDRFYGTAASSAGVFSLAQDTSAPTGFVNSIKVTVTTEDASIASDLRYAVRQAIEGTNISDLSFGTASAKTITLSFWVRSSLTGTFGGMIQNSAGNRTYVFSYSISAADTFEYKTITIAGDTTGTWLTTTGTGIQLNFSLGAASNLLNTAGSWYGTNYQGATGQTNVIETNGATWYITGVQLEVGTVATPFERRPYGTELALCQRYYFRFNPAASGTNTLGIGRAELATSANLMLFFPVQLRTAPTALEQSGTAGDYAVRYTNSGVATCNSVPTFSDANVNNATANFTVASGLTGGQSVAGRAVNTNSYLAWSAEL